MTTPQPGPGTPSEISDLLTTSWTLPSGASLAEQTAFFEWKADLLSRNAAAFDTPEACTYPAEVCGEAAAIPLKAPAWPEARP